MLGCFNPILGKIWTNPAIGLQCTNVVNVSTPLLTFDMNNTCNFTRKGNGREFSGQRALQFSQSEHACPN